MTTADIIAAALRPVAPNGKLAAVDVPLINQLAALWDARVVHDLPELNEPSWIGIARAQIGEREITGPKHNSWIANGWRRLGASWFNDDETPWCGFFMADCLDKAGLPYPKNFPAAASFRDWGEATAPQLGAIGVKARKGGNHVFFIVGETPDKAYYKALGGNQGNMVSIVDIRKDQVDAVRWPKGAAQVPLTRRVLPILPRGTISGSEA